MNNGTTVSPQTDRMSTGKVTGVHPEGYGWAKDDDTGNIVFFHVGQEGLIRSAGERSNFPIVLPRNSWDGNGTLPTVGTTLRYVAAPDEVHYNLKAVLWVKNDDWLKVRQEMACHAGFLHHIFGPAEDMGPIFILSGAELDELIRDMQ